MSEVFHTYIYDAVDNFLLPRANHVTKVLKTYYVHCIMVLIVVQVQCL